MAYFDRKNKIMIADTIKNTELYFNMGERIAIGLRYIEETDFSKMAPGKYPIDEDNIFAIVNEYKTKPISEAKTENHMNYIDIQYIVKGKELMGYAPYMGQEPTVDYNSEKDVAFYNCDVSFMTYEEDSFAIFFPDDIHTPGIAVDEPSDVIKVVVKVKID